MARITIIAGNARSLVANRGALIGHWRRLGHEVDAIVPTVDWMPEVEALGIPIHRVELLRTGTNPVGDVSYAQQVWRILRRRQPSHVFAYGIKPVVYGLQAARLGGVRQRYAMITGLGYLFTGDTVKQRALRAIGTALYRSALGNATAVFFQNPDDIDAFVSGGLVSKRQVVRVWGSGIDLDTFPEAPLPGGPTAFLMIARVLRDKGVVEYLRAARLVAARHPGVRLLLLGPHDPQLPHAVPRDELETLLAEGHVEWLGATKDVRPFIGNAHVVVLPSYREGTPRAILEGMAMGRAAIVTDVPGCRETVVPGRNGLLVPVRDSEALAEAMCSLADDRERVAAMGRAGRELAEVRFDVRRVNETISGSMGLSTGGAPRPAGGMRG